MPTRRTLSSLLDVHWMIPDGEGLRVANLGTLMIGCRVFEERQQGASDSETSAYVLVGAAAAAAGERPLTVIRLRDPRHLRATLPPSRQAATVEQALTDEGRSRP